MAVSDMTSSPSWRLMPLIFGDANLTVVSSLSTNESPVASIALLLGLERCAGSIPKQSLSVVCCLPFLFGLFYFLLFELSNLGVSFATSGRCTLGRRFPRGIKARHIRCFSSPYCWVQSLLSFLLVSLVFLLFIVCYYFVTYTWLSLGSLDYYILHY